MDKYKNSIEQQVDILLKEYDTLRSEILLLTQHRFAFIGFVSVVMMYAFFKEDILVFYQFCLLALSGFILFFVWSFIGSKITKCSSHVAKIEQQINGLVAVDELLSWETKNQKNELHQLNKKLSSVFYWLKNKLIVIFQSIYVSTQSITSAYTRKK